jgi:hypothetical protein
MKIKVGDEYEGKKIKEIILGIQIINVEQSYDGTWEDVGSSCHEFKPKQILRNIYDFNDDFVVMLTFEDGSQTYL